MYAIDTKIAVIWLHFISYKHMWKLFDRSTLFVDEFQKMTPSLA